MKKENYLVPAVEVVSVSTEALVCASPLTVLAWDGVLGKNNIDNLSYGEIDSWDD